MADDDIDIDWISHVWDALRSEEVSQLEQKIVDRYNHHVRAASGLERHEDYMLCLKKAIQDCGAWREPPSAVDIGAQEYDEIMRLLPEGLLND